MEAEKKMVNKKKRRKRLIKTLLIRFIALGVFLFIMLSFVGTIRIIHDNDMYPSISDGQAVVVYRLGKIYVNEAVLYKANGKEKTGRIIAQGGDKVEIKKEGLFVNGNVLYNSLPYETKPPTSSPLQVTVPEGQYFILNDYRERMTDSRTFGCVSDVIGTIVFTVKYRGI